MTRSAISADIVQAARGVAAITQRAIDDQDAALLTYVAVYACGFAGQAGDLERYRALARCFRDEAFMAQLYRCVPDTVEVTGWSVTGRDEHRLLIGKDGMQAFLFLEQVRSAIDPGASLSFRVPALRGGVMPGFVVRTGTSEVFEPSTDLSRLYLNLRPTAATWALGTLARSLDAGGVPYEMKVLANPRAYVRRDSCVVYVPSDHEEQAVRLVARALEDSRHGVIGRGGPRLTGRVSRGLHLAHEPADVSNEGISYGQWVAKLFQAAAKGTYEPGVIAVRVRELIAQTGRDPRLPYLRPTARRQPSYCA